MADAPPEGWRVGWPAGSLAGCLAGAAAVAGSPWLFAAGVFAAMVASAVAAAFLLGLAAERILRRFPATDGVGGLVGIAVALLCHPGMALVFALCSIPTGGFAGVGDLLAGVGAITVLTLMFWSWVTVPLGFLGGWLAGQLVMRHRARRAAAA